MSEFYVYAHLRLGTGRVFYVGKGKGARAHTNKSRSAHWKNIVAKDGGRDVAMLATGLDEELAFLAEVEAIDAYRRHGYILVNKTDGGDGVSGYVPLKPPHNKGKPCSEEMKALISATLKRNGCLPPIGWNRGKKTPLDVVEKRRPALVAAWAKAKESGARVVTAETRAKQREAKVGKPLSEGHRKNLSEALKASKYTRVMPDNTGSKRSPESRAKMSASMKGRKATNRRAVKCLDTGEIFESATAAAVQIGRKQHTLIAACCGGKVRTAYGLRFEYVGDSNG